MRSCSPTDNWEFGPKDEAMREALARLVSAARVVCAQIEDGSDVTYDAQIALADAIIDADTHV